MLELNINDLLAYSHRALILLEVTLSWLFDFISQPSHDIIKLAIAKLIEFIEKLAAKIG